MALSPGSKPENLVNFRAPPPTPIATDRLSSVTDGDFLTEFLQHSLRLPELNFPRRKSLECPPAVDFRSLSSTGSDSASRIFESVAGIGCFQLINHGISPGLFRSASAAAAAIFEAPVSQENPYGYEGIHDGKADDGERVEEFVWCRDEGLKSEMAGIRAAGYSYFSDEMERLSSEIEAVAGKILAAIREDPLRRPPPTGAGTAERGEEGTSPATCYLRKHRRNVPPEVREGSLRCDLMRTLISGTELPHALCIHVACDGPSVFHVYSEKAWVSFCPAPNALVITVGDELQAWSGGKYRHVIGRPIYKSEEEGEETGCVSMAFMYSPLIDNSSCRNHDREGEKTISIAQQALLALFFVLIYQILLVHS